MKLLGAVKFYKSLNCHEHFKHDTKHIHKPVSMKGFSYENY